MKKRSGKQSQLSKKATALRFKILLDTCVWLDLIKDQEAHHVIATLEELVRQGIVKILLPRMVREEFDRNKERVVGEAIASCRRGLVARRGSKEFL